MKLFTKNNYISINNKSFNNIIKNKIIIKIFITTFFFFNIINKFLYNIFIKYEINRNYNSNYFYLYDYFKDNENNLEHFSLIDINFAYSFKYKIAKVEYLIGFYDKNNNFILPSDLTLYKKLHVICYIENRNFNIYINSFANIHKNSYYKCIEYYNINEKLQFGIKIYRTNDKEENIEEYIIYFFSESFLNFDNLHFKKEILFDPLVLEVNYLSMVRKITDKKINETLKLKKSYIKYPYCTLKRNVLKNENIWGFANIYNEYFGFCKGNNCLNMKNYQKEKYLFYLKIIDNNRNINKKTDYLFIDFIFAELSSDDAYPVFKEMEKRKYKVHYLTENSDIYNEYCNSNAKCLTVIKVNKDNFILNGDFIEKYLDLILKLKQVISNSGTYFNFITNLYYNIEYITYISTVIPKIGSTNEMFLLKSSDISPFRVNFPSSQFV